MKFGTIFLNGNIINPSISPCLNINKRHPKGLSPVDREFPPIKNKFGTAILLAITKTTTKSTRLAVRKLSFGIVLESHI